MMDARRSVYSFEDYRCSPDPVFALPPDSLQPSAAPIVIDNGSFQCRAGWACAAAGFEEPLLVFRAAAARSRGAARSDALVGNDIPSLEPLRWTVKSAFDRNTVVNFDIQELVFDYVFTHLGINSQAAVDHAVVVSEPACNPLQCRQMMSELLFECYGVPALAYGVDALFSFYCSCVRHGHSESSSALLLSSGHHCSHVLPLVHGRLDAVNCRRVNVGGAQATSYLQRLLQLKYPANQSAVTLSRAEELLHRHAYVAADYQHELEKWSSVDFYQSEVQRVQLPLSSRVCVAAEDRTEKKAQHLRRLQEINTRRREERLQTDQRRLDTLLSVQELLRAGHLELLHKRLVELNMDSAEELQSYIHKLSASVEQQKQLKVEAAEAEAAAEEGKECEVDVQDESSETGRSGPQAEHHHHHPPHQLLLGTERVRAPEVLFQPALMGEEQMGLTETLQLVLDLYPPEQQEALVKNVFLTGGNLQYCGLLERVERELLAMRPFKSHFRVSAATRPALDAWAGAREWALRNPSGAQGWISRQEYEENGGEYLKEHFASNVSVPLKLHKAPKATSAEGDSSATCQS